MFPKKKNYSLSQNKIKVDENGYKAFKEKQDNLYLGLRIKEIFSRSKKKNNQDFFDSKKIKLHSFQLLSTLRTR